jgi:hypothetical protein
LNSENPSFGKEGLSMKRLTTWLLALTILGVMASTVRPAAAASAVYVFDFNNTLEPFHALTFSPTSTSDQVLTLGRDCFDGELTAGLDGLDNGCARLTNGDGASFVAMLGQIKGDGIAVRVEFLARDLKGCGRCAVIVYAGRDKPQGIGSFQKVGPVLDREWAYYQYQVLLDGSDPVISVGLMNLDGTKGMQRAGIDNLRVSILDN